MRWRVVRELHGGRVEAITVSSAADLRRALAVALADPHTVRYRYFRYDEPVDHCPRGHPVLPVNGHREVCRCGVIHIRTVCLTIGCDAQDWNPPRHRACGPLPQDPQARPPRRH